MTSLTDLANSVLQKTRDGKLTWTELSPGSFLATIGEDSIIIDRQGAPLYVMRFVNPQGIELERIAGKSMESDGNKMLSEIYELARRQALRVDEILRNMKRSLDSL